MACLRIALSLAVVVVSVGCKETTSSKNIRTGGIAMVTDVVAKNGSSTRVRTKLLVGGDESNTYVLLQGKDRLTASADGDDKEMEAIDDGVYEAKFNIADEGTLFEIKLERGDDDVSAKANSGKLPAPFDITSDFGKDPISRDDDELEITWEPSGQSGDMKVEFDDDANGCIYSDDADIPGDSGSYIVKPKTLESTNDDAPESCDVTATLSRVRKGTSDAALDSESKFTLSQVRSVVFVSAP